MLITTITQITIHRDDSNPVFGSDLTRVTLDDNAAGPYLIVHQPDVSEPGTLRIELDELEQVLKAARRLMRQQAVKDETC